MPPRIVTMNPPATAGGARDRSTVRPPVDWTGHHYKAISELTVDYTKIGREVARGRDNQRTYPALPGLRRG